VCHVSVEEVFFLYEILADIIPRIIDDTGNNIKDYNVGGQLCVRGPCVVAGYRSNHAANQDFVSEGIYHTGDIGYCDRQSKLWYLINRKKELIKVESTYFRDCVALTYTILIDPNVKARRRYIATSSTPEWQLGGCFIGTGYWEEADPDELYSFAQAAIAAAVITRSCVYSEQSAHLGGYGAITRRHIFFPVVKSPGQLDDRQTSTVGVTYLELPTISTTAIEPTPANLSSNITLPIDFKSPNISASDSANLFTCYANPTFGLQPRYPVIAADCYYLFYGLLNEPDGYDYSDMGGEDPGRSRKYGGCALHVQGKDIVARDQTRPLEFVLAAARVMNECVVKRGQAFGGKIVVGTKWEFFVKLSNLYTTILWRRSSRTRANCVRDYVLRRLFMPLIRFGFEFQYNFARASLA